MNILLYDRTRRKLDGLDFIVLQGVGGDINPNNS